MAMNRSEWKQQGEAYVQEWKKKKKKNKQVMKKSREVCKLD